MLQISVFIVDTASLCVH